MSISERVKYLRKDLLKLTQSEFGEKLGIGKAAISRIESNLSQLTEQNMKLICKEFHVNYIWLKEGEGEVFSTVEKSLIDRLTDEYELNPVQRRIIEQVITLSDDEINCFTEKFFGFKAVEKEQLKLLPIKVLTTCMTE